MELEEIPFNKEGYKEEEEKKDEEKKDKEKNEGEKEHCVYMLYSPSTKRTYIGYTCNIKRRLRQHNGEIQGGAKTTKRGRPWVMVFYIKGFPDEYESLRLEWRCHHPHKFLPYEKRKIVKRGHGYEGRIESVCSILELDKVCSKGICLRKLNLEMIWTYDGKEPHKCFLETKEKFGY